MYKTLASQNLDILKRMIGAKIISVTRQIYSGDTNLDDFQQNADGAIEIKFDNDIIVNFRALTEANSISVFKGEMPVYGESYIYTNVSNNSFWTSRIGQKITEIYILQSEFCSVENPSEFGLKIVFENNTKVCIEYLDEEDFPDTLRIVNECNELKFRRIAVTK
jgi:hypothetical protein